MKKFLSLMCVITALSLLLLCGCATDPEESKPSEEQTDTPADSVAEGGSKDPASPADSVGEGASENTESSLNDASALSELPIELPAEFYYSSGAGGWYTCIELSADGSFKGEYFNADGGVIYSSVFTGAFTQISKENDYTYTMTLGSFKAERPLGEKWVEEGLSYECALAEGIENGKQFKLYLPEAPQSELPEDFVLWRPDAYASEDTEALSCYGIHNTETDAGFFYKELIFEDTNAVPDANG